MKIKLYDIFSHWNKNVIWVFSDPHFDDVDCKSIDPSWPSSEEQIKLINKFMSKNDVIIFLGDIGNEEYIKNIKGYKILITGNHDKGISNYIKKYYVRLIQNKDILKEISAKDLNDAKIILEELKIDYPHSEVSIYSNNLFNEVYDGPLFISNKILLSHEPVDLPFGINIHGHVHSGQHIVKKENSVMINMAADVINFKPIRLDTLVSYGKVEDIHRQAIDKAKEKK